MLSNPRFPVLPCLTAFIYATGALGPVVGFALGALMLQFYVDLFTIDTETLNLTPDDPRWVGAWWGGFVICGSLLLLVSIPFFSFPRMLSKETRKLLREDEAYLQRLLNIGVTKAKAPENATPSSNYGKDIKGKGQTGGESVCGSTNMAAQRCHLPPYNVLRAT